MQRLRLIDFLHTRRKTPLDEAIRIAQKLLDRIIFIAFCEDRELLPEKCLERAYSSPPAFSRVTNPRWHNFLGLFHAVDKGNPGTPPIERFNGGLFAEDTAIDELDLDDEPWTAGFKGFGAYDFSEEVNVEVLGHLFERSITELEKLRVGGLFALKANIEGDNGNGNGNGRGAAKPAKGKPAAAAASDDDSPLSKMPKSAQRKRFGIYYTPPAFTGLIVERTVDVVVRDRFAALAKQHKVDPESREQQDPARLEKYWRGCLESLKAMTLCDPACGSGAFLIRAYDALDAHYKAVAHGLGGAGVAPENVREIEESIPDLILNHNLYGVDLSREGVEITQLALWIRSARKGKTLADLSMHIVHGNSLVSDKAVDPHALDWDKTFPSIFGKGNPAGFDCVIGNPPWERVKVQEREFFSLTDPETAQTVNAADRRKRVAALPKVNPDLHASYLASLDKAQRMLDYARLPPTKGGRYPLTGKGDVNLYMLFAELARSIVAPDGVVGVLVPSGIATDDTTKAFFNDLMDRQALVSLYDFENKLGIFEDVHRSYKFTALVFRGGNKRTEQADFVFFAHGIEEVAEINKQRHIILTAKDMKLLNPNTKTCPIFRTRRDAALTRKVYERVPILIDESRKIGGNPWGIKFCAMFHQTNDAELFGDGKVWIKRGYSLQGNVYVKNKKQALPLYEAKMFRQFDHRHGSVFVDTSNWVNQGQTDESSLVQHQNPEHLAIPRWWVSEEEVDRIVQTTPPALLAFRDITRATDTRTMIAAFLPLCGVINTAPIALFTNQSTSVRQTCCLLGNWNSMVLDFIAKTKVGHMHMNFFILEQLPTLTPDVYADKCPWSQKVTLEHWISERVLKLSCTAEDMLPLATACNFKGSRGDGIHIWKEADRAAIRAELDAAFFHLYQIQREDAEYMLSTFTGTGYIHPDERGADGGAWQKGGIGEEVLNAYDALGSLASS